MKNRLFLLLLAVAVYLPAATLPRTFVAHDGHDADDCSRAHPCQTFTGALLNTSAGGEIDVLDSGEFGAVTITQDLTIDGLGHIALASNIHADAGNITIRNITMGSISVAIQGAPGTTLRVEHVAIHPDTTAGGSLDTGVKISGTGYLQDVRVTGATFAGVVGAGGGTATLNHCTLYGNNIGVTVSAATAIVDHSIIQGNTIGVSTDWGNPAIASGTIMLSETTVTDNGTGLQVGGTGTPVLVSYGNNRIYGNTVNGSQTLLTSQR